MLPAPIGAMSQGLSVPHLGSEWPMGRQVECLNAADVERERQLCHRITAVPRRQIGQAKEEQVQVL